MREKLTGLAAIGATSALLLSGDVNIETPPPERVSIEPFSHAPELPAAIARVAANTVEVTLPPARGSGTIVNYRGTRVVVTAAHAVTEAKTNCWDNTIVYPHGTYLAKEVFVSERTKSEPVFDRDTAVLVSEEQIGLAEYAPLEVQDKVKLHKGQTVFSLGYGPRNEHYDPNPGSYNEIERQPIIIPGIVLGVEQGHVDVLTSLAGYEPSKDTVVRVGDSGGPLVSDAGEYIGDAVYATNKTGKQIEKMYSVDLPHASEGRWYQIATAEIVDQQVVWNMMPSVQHCK